MTTTTPPEALFSAYCAARGFEVSTIPVAHARYLFDAVKEGVTPEMMSDVVKDRMKRPYATQSMKDYCLRLRHLIGSEEAIADLIDEANAIKAKRRKATFSPGKAEVLRTTGRSGEPEQPKVRRVDEIFQQMREKTI